MKSTIIIGVGLFLALNANGLRAEPVAAVFSYQGQLKQDGQLAQGIYDLQFTLYDTPNGGSPVAGPVVSSSVYVTNGLFVAELDFGQGVFAGQALWLEIAVRTNNAVEFTTLSPRQPIRPSPYALHAVTAGTALNASNFTGVVGPHQLAGAYTNALVLAHPANVIFGSVTGNGSGLANVNAATLRGLEPTDFWQTTGNTGTINGTHFVGTIDAQPLELRVNNTPAFRLFPGNNVVAGAPDNIVALDVLDASIGGGTGNRIESGASASTVGGGIDNRIGTNAISATIAGGDNSGIGTRSSYAVITGGNDNDIGADANAAFIGGGEENLVDDNSSHAVIAGGERNVIQYNAQHAVVGGGQRNWIGTNAVAATISGGQENHIGPSAQGAVIGGGSNNYIENGASWATIAGGSSQTVEADARHASITGGYNNEIHSWSVAASIGGGDNNIIRSNSWFAAIGGGANNTVNSNAWFATIPGGRLNEVSGRYAFAAGNRAKALHEGAFVWADSTDSDFSSTRPNQLLLRATGGVGINTNLPQTALHVAGTVTADEFRGSGASLRNIDADRLDGRHGDEFALAKHVHGAGDITSGTLDDARLSANIARLNAAQAFSAANQFTNPGNVFVGTFQGDGTALTNLDASKITTGTLPDARLGSNIPRLNSPASFSSTLTAPLIQASNIVADISNQNNAALTPGLVLGGTGSGEGIASKRTSGGNQYGLDLFTAFTSRLAIANNGAIHIGAGNAFSVYGDARSSIYVLRGTSTGTSYSELFLPGSQRLSVPVNSTWTFRIFVAGRASNGKAAGYLFRGFLENENGTVRMLEAPNTEDYAEDDTTWDANVTANDSYDALIVTARGNTGDSVRWTAVVYTIEVKW